MTMEINKTGLLPEARLIFEKSRKGLRAAIPPDSGVERDPEKIPERFRRRTKPSLPELGQPELVRHFTNMSRLNFCIDTVFYPLGSCTMKHNPRVNEAAAAQPGFLQIHPDTPLKKAQGILRIGYELMRQLAELTGLPGVSLQPAAGAHGELTSMLIIKARLEDLGEKERNVILIPDTAHGTNPASAHYAGFKPRKITSGPDGNIDIEDLKKNIDDRIAGIMITNPNTLGLFEKRIAEVCDMVHQAGGLVYMDGANFNAIMGIVRPADFGTDLMHMNLHKTFSTPHGGGGPGAGPIAVTKELEPYLPDPLIIQNGDGLYELTEDREKSIGRMRTGAGNLGVIVRAWAYIRTLGLEGLRQTAETAVLNANYLRKKLKDHFEIPFGESCMHEFVLSASRQKKKGARALDFAKNLIDYSIHPPTIYFPLIVNEAMMIEPTETESPETLDRFASVMIQMNAQLEENPEELTRSPVNTPVTRLDELSAARKPVLSWPEEEEDV